MTDTRVAESQNDLAIAVTRNAVRSRRKRDRRRLGLKVRQIVLEREILDALETAQFLDPFERGDHIAEEKAVIACLRAHLWKELSRTSPRPSS